MNAWYPTTIAVLCHYGHCSYQEANDLELEQAIPFKNELERLVNVDWLHDATAAMLPHMEEAHRKKWFKIVSRAASPPWEKDRARNWANQLKQHLKATGRWEHH